MQGIVYEEIFPVSAELRNVNDGMMRKIGCFGGACVLPFLYLAKPGTAYHIIKSERIKQTDIIHAGAWVMSVFLFAQIHIRSRKDIGS